MHLWLLLTASLVPLQVQAAAVFSHFMVGNTQYFNQQQWQNNMQQAQAYHIDAFALNMAYGWEYNYAQVSLAFSAANTVGFQLFFSFDYAGNGSWPKADVTSLIQQYGSNGAHYQYKGKPFVSTFEGPDSAGDWFDIKASTGCFFVPDWSSIGAGPALAKGVADGLFSWAAWRWGDWPMSTYTDAAYNVSLNGLPYMMAVSPWFYTNLPGYDKNWLWPGDSLWFDRWQEVWNFQPEWVEIVSWNDYGECHHIGPLDSTQYDLFDENHGKAPFNYVDQMPHDAWGWMLPFLIDTYKNGFGTFNREHLYIWHRLTPVSACDDDDTSGNTASQLQLEFKPQDIVEDRIYVSALLAKFSYFSVQIGGTKATGLNWTSIPDGGIGMYHGSYSFSGLTGYVEVCLETGAAGGSICAAIASITTDCSSSNGYTNWNAITAFANGETIALTRPKLSLSQQKCIKGFGTNEFDTICRFVCKLGYCPAEACSCEAMGAPPVLPKANSTIGYSKNGMIEFQGLCAFACAYGFCDLAENTVCQYQETTLYIPTVSPFNPPACRSGTGLMTQFSELCSWSCTYGYCPIIACNCTSIGDLNLPTPPVLGKIEATFVSNPFVMGYNDLCTWTCSRGHCPESCSSNYACVSGSGEGNFGGLCGFSCGYGFCPEPCTCLARGVKSTPPTYDPTIIGYSDMDGPNDDALYGPLCNFTCSHGYCPSPNACLATVTIDPDDLVVIPTLPTLESYIEDPNITYSAGDFFSYISDEYADLSVDSILLEAGQIPNGTCDIVTPGSKGASLGCVGEAVEFLMVSLLANTYVLENAKRDISNLNYHFVTHPDWEATDNCTTTHCMLAENAPLHSWTAVGNGSYNGADHSLHFLNTGTSHAYRASRIHPAHANGSSIQDSEAETDDLSKRAQLNYKLNSIHATYSYRPDGGRGYVSFSDRYTGGSPYRDVISNLASESAMESALVGFPVSCITFKDKSASNEVIDDNDTIIGVMAIETLDTLTTSDMVDDRVTTCTEKEKAPHPFLIWPVDGLDINEIQALLDSFPTANQVKHISLNGWGMLYWEANLTPVEQIKISQRKQTLGVDPRCLKNCEDPSFFIPPNKRDHSRHDHGLDEIIDASNTSVITKKQDESAREQKRNEGITTQNNALPDLYFISNNPGSSTTIPESYSGTYAYDKSAGKNVYVYCIDPHIFDMSLPEFSAFSGVVPKLFGAPGYVPSYNPGSATESHGNAMLALIAGADLGVAKRIIPRPISFQHETDRGWLVDALDYVYKDFHDLIFSGQLALDIAPLAVLSMSFGFTATAPVVAPAAYERAIAKLLNQLAQIGVFPISAAGNDGVVINTLPARLANPNSPVTVKDMLVLGSVEFDGTLSTWSNFAFWLDLWAPGFRWYTPFWSSGVQRFAKAYGTSGSTAKTAGLAAYFIGLTDNVSRFSTVADLRAHIMAYAYARAPGYPAIFNGAPPPP